MAKSRSKSSGRWLREHFDDHYVKEAQRMGYRSRAVFKLLELLEKDPLLKPGMTVIDLGAAPGGWSQIAAQKVGGEGRVIASDILTMDSLPDVEFLQGDFSDDAVFEQLLEMLDAAPVDLVLSDMSPNMSGIKHVDQPRSMHLVELALDFAVRVLRPGGAFACKVFQGEGFDQLVQNARTSFGKVVTRKPAASRPRSREVYLVAKNFKQKQ